MMLSVSTVCIIYELVLVLEYDTLLVGVVDGMDFVL